MITYWKKAIDTIESPKSCQITHVTPHLFNNEIQINTTATSVTTPMEDVDVKEEVVQIQQESTMEFEIEQVVMRKTVKCPYTCESCGKPIETNSPLSSLLHENEGCLLEI